MTLALFGLNPYGNNARTEMGFSNFQWVLDGKLARSSQPGHTRRDAVQTMSMVQVAYLKMKGIRCIVSVNEFGITPESTELLARSGITHHHFSVRDMNPPTLQQLQSASVQIQGALSQGQGVLVHCGFGQGRTGTVIAGWAMYQYMPLQARPRGPRPNLDAMCQSQFCWENFGIETAAQLAVVREVVALPALDIAPMPPTAGFGGRAGPAGSAGSAGSWRPPLSNASPPPFPSGPANLGRSSGSNVPPFWARFNSGN